MAPTPLKRIRESLNRGEVGDGAPGGQRGVVSAVSSPTMRALEERAERFTIEKAEAERRLAEAERRLRAAIEEMHNKRAHGGKNPRGIYLWDGNHPLCQHSDSCFAHGVGSLFQSFLLAYGVRVGIGVLIRALRLVRNHPSSVLDFQLLLSEKNLIVREEACRTGMLFGGFTGLYHLTRCLLRRLKGRETPMHTFVAGTVAGVSLFSLDDRARRRALALYLLARVGQHSATKAQSFHEDVSAARNVDSINRCIHIPFYLALTFVPSVALNFGKFSHEPSQTIIQATRSAMRSTCFLSCFVGIYQGIICFHRKFANRDHKAVYYIAGLLASVSLFIEKKSKRAELALYTLPRAADSLWYILINRHIIPDVAYGEVALFCVCMGGLMYFHEHEPNTMAKMLRILISRFVCSKSPRLSTLNSLSSHRSSGGPGPTAGANADETADRESSGASDDSPRWDITADNSESEIAGEVDKNESTPPLRKAPVSAQQKGKDGVPLREQLLYAQSQAQASEKLKSEIFQGL
ncbi:hypothetical protein CBR_g55399 [Chara braunii]|uniref:Transmembrane protein 135 N-terminal domain-containing protein n=1 Tax=Chara braunii TaxID=69332 RepID=A0A388K7Q3_CHABU|nr:hypothetical protein CBR_g55399 [Chara braunii]|eukprot:GBG66056.1 hypothetical protein CBR_g55399 [Chara braunii]